MKTIVPQKLVLLLVFIVTGAIGEINAQLTVPFTERIEFDNTRGNLIITGNDIVGVILDGSGGYPNPNRNYNGLNSNGNYVTAYIDVDNDPDTFSSSEGGLSAPRIECSELLYAGLYWSANYYLARGNQIGNDNYDNGDISSNDDTNVRLYINNGPMAFEYNVRYSDFGNDNSDIRYDPVTSYLVVAQPENGCGITNAAALAGNIAVVREGGSCSLREKVVNAEAAGAVGVVIVSNNGNLPELTGGGTAINIPSVTIGNDDITNENYATADLITTLNAQTNVVLSTLSTNGNDTGSNTSLPLTDPRKQGPADFRNIKFKVPGAANYTNVTATSVIFDGYRNTPTNPIDRVNDEVPYVCYANVTSLLDPNNYFGTYTVADMNATQGYTSGSDGACGGWMMVAVYTDPQDSSKYISISDGFAQIFSAGDPVDFTYTGFTTLQGTQPVEVKYGVAGLEGDRGILGDELRVQNVAGTYSRLGENAGTTNPNDNFFNSSITSDGAYITDRTPNSENTQGFDADIFDLPNAGNTLIGNNQTSATFQLYTQGDRYSVFFNAFSVTIIEPELQIIKRVYDIDGTTVITGNDIELGSEVFYDLEITNIGNEDFVDGSVVITDMLPANTNLVSIVTATLPPGVTFDDSVLGIVRFFIPSSIVETPNDDPVGVGDGPINIRFRAILVNTCEELRDACSDDIKNSATATYTGLLSGTASGTLSSAQLDPLCGQALGEASNVLINVPACESEVTFCNDDLLLVAGDGYTEYTWSGPGLAEVITTDNFYQVPTPQSGVYTVEKKDTDGVDPTCFSLTERFTVADFNAIDNPISDYVNGTTVVEEDCSGLLIPQILLCGTQTLFLETNFDPSNLDDISWQRLSPTGASCVSDPNDPCSLLNGNCTTAMWGELTGGDGTSFTVSEAGDYRIMAEFDGGCIIPFYFSVFKNDYQPTLSAEPIECGNDGSVTVTNVPNDFGFSLTAGGPYTNTTGVFAISASGDVTVYAIDTTFPGCEYTATINVPAINPTFSVTTTDPTCINNVNNTGTGTINILVTGGIPEYQYTISSPALGGANPIIVPNASANNGNYSQTDLPSGTYDVEVISNRPTPECVFSTTVTINAAPAFDAEVVLIAQETCDTGALVQVNVLNGSGDYLYADSSGVFGVCNIFEIPLVNGTPTNPATVYTFSVSDNTIPSGTNACIITANIDNITPYELIVIDSVTLTQPACAGDSGQIRVDVSPLVAGRVYTYQLWDFSADPNFGITGSVDPSDDENPSLWVLVDEVASTNSQTITFTGVPENDSYFVEVSNANTTPAIANANCTIAAPPANICPVRDSVFAITAPAGIIGTATLKRPLSCIPSNEDALIEVAGLSGGSGSYEWSLDNTTYTNVTTVPFDIAVSTSGSYTVYIRNQGTGDCPVPFAITVPVLPTIDSITFTPGTSDCTDQSALVSFEAQPALSAADITAGVVYEYNVSPTGSTGFDTTNSYTIAQDVTYTVIARRSDTQCTFTDTYRVAPILPIDISVATETTPVVCVGESNGALSFSVINSTSFDYTVTYVDNTPATITVASGNSTTSPVNISGLAAETYTITVADTNPGGSGSALNCSDTIDVDVTEPAVPLSFTIVEEDSNCSVDSGTITVTAVGGRGNYHYELRDGGGAILVAYQNTTNVFNGLAVGDYVVYVRDGDSAACQVNSPTITIIQSASPTLALEPGGNQCYDGTNPATQWFTIDPGIAAPFGPFEYSIDGGTAVAITSYLPGPAPANTFEVSNLTPGTYTITVTNTDTNCTTAGLPFTINPELTITATLANDNTCTASASITFVAVGGSATYDQFDLYTAALVLVDDDITSPYTLTTAGDYVIRVTDSQLCTADSNPITVTDYTAITTSAPVITDPDCPTETGVISITVTAGEGPFTYVLDGDVSTTQGPTGTGPIIFSNVAVGAHVITITDTFSCPLDVPATITAPTPISGGVITESPLYQCDGGTIPPQLATLTVTGLIAGSSSGTYEYSIDGTNWQNSNVFNNQADGTYIILVRDSDGSTNACPFSLDPYTIDPLAQVTDLNFAQDTTVQCTALTQDITVSATFSGTDTIEYRISAPAPDVTVFSTNDDYDNLVSGTTYTFEARTNVDLCVYSETYTVPTIDFIAVNGTVVNEPLCNGQNNGELSFTVSGIDLAGGATYSYEITRIAGGAIPPIIGASQTLATIQTGDILAAGTYNVLVRDETTNCTDDTEVIIGEPDVITFTIDPVDRDCVTNTATVTISAVTGGSGAGYTWILNDSGNVAVGPSRPISDPYLNVPNGTGYQIIVSDGNSCTSAIQSFDIDQLPQIAATINPASDFCLDDGEVSFIIDLTSLGTPVYGYTITLGGTVVASENNIGATAQITTLPVTQAGAYTITITDSNGCPVTLNETIEPAVNLTVTQVADIACDALGVQQDAEFSFVVSGGYTPYDIAVSTDNGVSFVDHITNGTTPFANYTTSAAGTYVFRVTDTRGCTFTTSDFTVSAPVPPVTDPNPNNVTVSCDGDLGTAVITLLSGTDTPYEIDFDGAGYVTITGTQISFPNLAEGTYNYTIRSSRGCLLTESVAIIAPDPITQVSGQGNPVTCSGTAAGSGNTLGSVELTIAGGTGDYIYTLVEASNLFAVPLVAAATSSANPSLPTASTSITFNDVDFGQYYIFVEDNNGCMDNSPFGIFDVFSPPNDLLQNVTASGTCPGGVTFDIDVQGGSGINPPNDPPPGFEIRIVGGATPGIGDYVPLNDLVTGPTAVDANTPIRNHRYTGLEFNRTYILEVRDVFTNCVYQEIVAPEPPPNEPNIINTVVTDVTCNETLALDNGSISFEVSGYDAGATDISYEVFDQITNVSLGAAYSGSIATAFPATLGPIDIFNFAPGRYYLAIREVGGTGCPNRFDFTIDIPDELVLDGNNQTPANSCGTNAQIIMSTTGGTPFAIPPTADGYHYALVANGAGDPGAYPINTTNIIDLGNTNGQIQDIWVADANGCSDGPYTVTTVVNPLPTITASFIDDCAYDNSNVIDVDGTGLGTLLYQLDGGTAVVGSIDNNNHQFIVSTSGSYIITISDDSGCSVSTVPVTVYDELVISAAFTSVPTCEAADGTITTTITSGAAIGVLSYELQDGTGTATGNVTGDASGTYTNVAPGSYIVEVTDAGRGIAPGCSFTAPVSIDAPTPPVLVPEETFVTCIGDTDGVITAALTPASIDADPTVIYEYRISAPPVDVTPFQTSPIFSGLGVGLYTIEIRVTKPNGALNVVCLDTDVYEIDQPTDPTATITLESAYGCTGTNINFPVITVDNFSGGDSASYMISYTDPSGNVVGPIDPVTIDTDGATAGTQIIANESGSYTFTIYDANNCSNVLAPFAIPVFPIMTDVVVNTVTGINCTTNTEEVTVTVTGGTGPYDFIEINGAVASQLGVASGGATTTSASFFLPGVGNYTFRVLDQGTQCSIETAPYEIDPYDTITAAITLTASNIQCFGDITGEVELTVTGHTGAYNYIVTNTTTGTVSATLASNTTANPLTISTLEAGSIQVQVIDPASACEDVSNTVAIIQPTQLTLALVSNTNANCNDDGIVAVTANGGTSPYTYTAIDVLTGGVTFTDTNATGVFDLPVVGASTDYTISVVDTNSCTSNPVSINETVTITPTSVLNALTVDDVCTHDGAYVISASGTSGVIAPGTGALRFQLDTGVIEDANNGSTAHTFSVATPGTYTVTAYDENGCPSNVESITILPELVATADFSADPTCRDFDGTITVTVTGGSDFAANPANFTFILDGVDSASNPVNIIQTGAGSNIFTLVSAGTYTVEIRDVNIASITAPCSITIDVPILSIPVDPIPTAVGTPVSCIAATDGTVSVTLQAGTDIDNPYTYQIFIDNAGTPGAQVGVSQIDNPVFTDLPFDDYIVIVTSDRGCAGQIPVTVPNATQVATTITQSAYSCAADNSSVFPTITVTITDGTAPYSISYVTPSGGTITVLNVIDANGTTPEIDFNIIANEVGDYLISVTDSNGCTTAPVSDTETILAFPIMINPTVTIVTDITCAVDEEVNVSIQGGSDDYLFELIDTPPAAVDTPFGTDNANFTLPRVLGIYTFRVTDQITNCTITVSHEVDEYDFIEVVATLGTPETCFGDADGTINVSITGYGGSYDYIVLDADGNPTAILGGSGTTPTITIPALPQGTYIIEIVETADPLCTERSNVVTVTGPGAALVTSISPINDTVSCIPGGDGSFQASVTGAALGNVTYTIAPPGGTQDPLTPGLFMNLSPGLYTVTAQDSSGCSDDEQFTIESPMAIIVDPIANSSVTCFEDSNGSILVNASGGQGVGTYLYTLTFPDGTTTSGPQSTNEFNNLGAGTYTIEVSDNLNCSASTTAIIDEPNEVTVSVDAVTQVSCAINTVDVTVSGTSDVAITTYYYIDQDGNEVSNGGSGLFVGLSEGQYLFFVENVNGCRSDLSVPVPVIPVNQIVIQLDELFSNVSCFNEASGIIDASVTGGIGDYVFSLTNNTTTQTFGPQAESEFSNLPPGDYTYFVTSDRGCASQENFTIINPTEFEVTPPDITDVLCFGFDNGSVIVFAVGGTPPYSFAISTDPGQFFADASDNDPNQHTFTDLVPGIYQVFAQDANGCRQVYDVPIAEPVAITASVDPTSIRSESCLGANDGGFTVTVTGGTPPYFTNITNNDSDYVQDKFDYGLPNEVAPITPIPGGITEIFVRDANNCKISISVDIPDGADLQARLENSSDCPDYTTSPVTDAVYYVEFIVTGADAGNFDIIYTLTDVGNPGNVIPSQTGNPVFQVPIDPVLGTVTYEGSMSLTRNASTPQESVCVVTAAEIGTITLDLYTPLNLPFAEPTNNALDPNEHRILLGETEREDYNASYTYYVAILPALSDGSVLDSSLGNYTELATNVFSIDVTSSYAIRVVDNSFNDCSVTIVDELTYVNIIIPNFFNPSISTWYPTQTPAGEPFKYLGMEVKVFDRYGRLLYDVTGAQVGWEGKYKGKVLPTGDYWFTVILNDIDNREFTGHFTLYR